VWVHARQSIVNMQLCGLSIPTCNRPGHNAACPGMGPKHDVTEGIMTLAFCLQQILVISLISIGGKLV